MIKLLSKRLVGNTSKSKTFNFPNEAQITELKAILSHPSQILENDIDKYTQDWQGQYKGEGSIVLFPKIAQEASQILSYCNQNKLPVVFQSGNTSLVAGATPIHKEIVVSMEKYKDEFKMNNLSEMITVSAGYTLQDIQNYLAEHGFETPFDIGARGSCLIGGNVSTQAGGINFVKYGILRGNIVGLEVVLADGTILDMTSENRKDNTGTDLKQIFIGSEGTLGLITKVNMLVKRIDKFKKTLFIKTQGYEKLLKIHNQAKAIFTKDLAAIEYLDTNSYYIVQKGLGDILNFPFESGLASETFNDFYVLIEISSQSEEYLESQIENFYEELEELVDDMLMAETESHRRNFWEIRENVVTGCKAIGYTFKYDISLPIDKIESFMDYTNYLCGEKSEIISSYGHIGDGNIHLNIISKEETDKNAFRDYFEEDLMKKVVELKGSISAEHGLGKNKKQYLHLQKGDGEIEYMKKIKQVMDPNGILNPGKVL